MNKKAGIIVALVLSLVFTMLIVNSANKNYRQVSEKAKVAEAVSFIPAGGEINRDNIKEVEVLKSSAKGVATLEEALGKAAKVSMVNGQLVYREALEPAGGLQNGFVEVFVPVELSASALAVPGQVVNVHVVDKEKKAAPVLVKNVRVLHSMDNQGNELQIGGNSNLISTPKNNSPASVGLEIPVEQAEIVVFAASQKAVYLSRAK